MSEVEAGTGSYVNPYELWDPTINQGRGGNVWAPEGVHAYMANNPNNFKGYSGSVQVANGNTRIHPEAFGVQTGTHQEAPGYEGMRSSYERMNMGDSGAVGQFGNFQRQGALNAQVAPGVRPNFGFLPGSFGGYDMMTQLPTNWDKEYGDNPYAGAADPFETKFLDTLSQKGFRSPKYMDMQAKRGSTELPNFGRGFHYEGQATPEEQQMVAQLNAGQPVDFNRFANLRNTRITQNKLSGLQEFASKYYGPALMATVGAIGSAGIGGIGGALYGAGAGAFAQGAQTRWQNPAAVGLGAAGGFAGGYGAGQLGQAAGLGPVAGQALTGVGRSVGGSLGYGLGGGKMDGGQMLRNAGIAGATGALAGAISPGGPFAMGPPGLAPGLLRGTAVGAAGSGLNAFLPGAPQPPQRPLNPQEIAKERERQRQLRIQQQSNPYAR